MKVLLLLCALALNIFSINAQIKGKILDGKTMMPLQGVNIYLQQDSVAGDETIVRLVLNKFIVGTEAWEFRSSNMFVYILKQN